MQLALGLLLSVVIASIGAALHWYGNSEYALMTYALALSVLPCTGQEFVRRVLYTQSAIVGATVNNFVSYGLQLAGIIIVVTQLGGVAATAPNAMLALGLSSLVASLLGMWQLRHHLAPRVLALLPERRSLRAFGQLALDTWRLSKWLMAQQVVNWLGTSGYGFLLAALLGPASFGAYRAAYQVVNVLNPIRQTAMNHLPSRAARVLAETGAAGLKVWVKRTTWALTMPFLVCSALVVMCTAPLADLMYGANAQLPSLHAVVAGGVLAYCINFSRTPLDYAVLVGGGARALFMRSLVLMAFAWSAGFALIWAMGIFGAVIAEVIGALIATALCLRIYAAMNSAVRTDQVLPNESPGEFTAASRTVCASAPYSIPTSGSMHS
jgi:O-antigen/teichoic acid export membrane protein